MLICHPVLKETGFGEMQSCAERCDVCLWGFLAGMETSQPSALGCNDVEFPAPRHTLFESCTCSCSYYGVAERNLEAGVHPLVPVS